MNGTKNTIIVVLILLVAGLGYYGFSNKKKRVDEDVFQKKQECSQYSNLIETQIKESGRVFENDTYTVKEIFYSPKLNTCLYAWVIYTTFEPKEIHSIDDVFGGGVFTTSMSESFYEEISNLKK